MLSAKKNNHSFFGHNSGEPIARAIYLKGKTIMKKLLLMSAAAAISLSLLAGCGDDIRRPGTATTINTPVVTTPPSSGTMGIGTSDSLTGMNGTGLSGNPGTGINNGGVNNNNVNTGSANTLLPESADDLMSDLGM